MSSMPFNKECQPTTSENRINILLGGTCEGWRTRLIDHLLEEPTVSVATGPALNA